MTSTTNASPASSTTSPSTKEPATPAQLDRIRKLTADCGYPLDPVDELPAQDAAELLAIFGRLWNEQHPQRRP